jgi:hypothetical protein
MKSIRRFLSLGDEMTRAAACKLFRICKVEKLIKNSVPLGEIYGDSTGGIEQQDRRLN